jgi:hypothetical protein
MARGGAALLLATAVALTASPAGAYCRSKACDDKPAYDDVWQTEPDPPCTKDMVGCLIEGTPLRWPAKCLSYSVHQDGAVTEGLDYEAVKTIVDASFATWQAADCGGAPPSLVVKNLGPVSCAETYYYSSRPNQNVFWFRNHDWPHQGSLGTALAITTVSYAVETGELYAADVEINAFELELTTTDDNVAWDLQSILTHEVGHFLGLGHSRDETATMWWSYDPGVLARGLAPDDVAGICEIYPPGRRVEGGSCEPRHGFTRECPQRPSACGVAHGTARPDALAAMALGAVAWLGRRSARRRRP